MDDRSISPESLYDTLGSAAAPLLVDVRRASALARDPRLIAGSLRLAAPPGGRPVVFYDAGGEGLARRAAGAHPEARFLAGGMAAWRAAELPTRADRPLPGQWVTRERPKIDRIACPWLVLRFLDPLARFSYVPAGEVLALARTSGGAAFDIAGAEFTHRGARCSFDAILAAFGLQDRALHQLARIVRGADTGRLRLAPQSAGLLAVSLGLSANFPDDHAMLAAALPVYDALYAWCRSHQDEAHASPPLAA